MQANNSNKTPNKINLSYLGDDFQLRLIKIFIEDKDEFKNDMLFINQNAFSNPYHRMIVGFIKDFVIENDYIPSYELLHSLVATKITNELDLEIVRETINAIKKDSNEGADVIKKEAIKFFQQQELTRFFNQNLDRLRRGEDIIDDSIKDDLEKILSIGKHELIWTNPYDNFEETFSPESVVHIPIGCKEIDDYLQGGLIKGNLILVAASSGTGKTTISTALAESAATFKCEANGNEGFKVMQIYFEDNHPAIRRKHMGAITNIEARFLNTSEYMEKAKELAFNYEHKNLIKKNIKLGRFRSGQLTPADLKQYIQLEINKGFRPDLIIIDYFECLANPHVKNITNEWKLETEKMRQLENFVSIFNAAILVMTQGTKQSSEGMLLTLDKIGGSAGKCQVGHIIITINRTQKDIEENRAELFIPKNREGKSGRVFRINLNNGIPKISVNEFFDDIDKLKETQKDEYRNSILKNSVDLAEAAALALARQKD